MQEVKLSWLVEQRDCVNAINTNFTNPIKRSGATLFVELPKDHWVDSGAIGHAYDYWVRCQLQPDNPSLIESFIGYEVCADRYEGVTRVMKALEQHASALRTRPRTEEDNLKALAACLFLAKFEAEYRSGYGVPS